MRRTAAVCSLWPGGQAADRALEDAGIEHSASYITNAVKHFKFEERGKRRIHKKPGAAEIAACRPWLEAEMRLIRPNIIVCLGATAARSVFGGLSRNSRARAIHRARLGAARDLDGSSCRNFARVRCGTAPRGIRESGRGPSQSRGAHAAVSSGREDCHVDR
jgi:uracil-DNA glycosylase